MQCPNLLPLRVRQRIATACQASFSRSDAANVSKVGASLLYGGTFVQLMNSKTKIFLPDVLTAGIKTYFWRGGHRDLSWGTVTYRANGVGRRRAAGIRTGRRA